MLFWASEAGNTLSGTPTLHQGCGSEFNQVQLLDHGEQAREEKMASVLTTTYFASRTEAKQAWDRSKYRADRTQLPPPSDQRQRPSG